MKKLFAIALLAFGLSATAAMADVQSGAMAPDFTFSDINGASHQISAFKGKTVVLEWTNPGCPFVQKFYKSGEMQRVQEEALKDSNVVWFSVNSSAPGKEGNMTAEEAKKWDADMKAHPTAYVLDPTGAFGKLYGAKATPTIFIIDKTGKVAYQGAMDSISSPDPADIKKADQYVLPALAALKAGKSPTKTVSKAYGCAVKYAD
jgi:thioredoxin-related protein